MAGNTLTPTGTISYNGFTFSSPHTEIIQFNAKPVMDRAGRTVVYYLYTIGIATMIESTSPTTIDTLMDTARKKLGKSGGILTT